MKVYFSRGFVITDMYADGEFNFDSIKHGILPVALNICAAGEHVPKIERAIRSIKERCRSICHSLPYTKFTQLMTKSLVFRAVQGMNACPNDQAVSTTMSPSGIVEGKLNPDFNRRRIAFGAYAFVFDRTNNKMDSRSTPGIALYESNEEDGFYFMSLATGKRVNARKWVPLPITDDVVARVSELADTQKQGALINNF